jgi:hypothetical protein
MSESTLPQPPAAAMPGSARLSHQPATSRRGRLRRRHAASSALSRFLSILRIRAAAPPLLGALGVLVVVGAALAALVGSGGHSALTSKRLASHRASPSPSPLQTQTTPAQLRDAKPPSGVRHHPRQRNSGDVGRRRAPKVHVVLAADHGSTAAASSSSSAVATLNQNASRTQSSAGTSQSATGAPVADTTNGSASSASSGATSRPAFGLNGTLGPGHSPNG